MRTVCPNCQKALKAAEDMKGKRVRCPACQAVFHIGTAPGAGHEASDSEEHPPMESDPTAKVRCSCKKCGHVFTAPVEEGGTSVKCPRCGHKTRVPETRQAAGFLAARSPAEPAEIQFSAKAALICKVVTLLAYAVAAVGLGFGNYTYYAWGASHDRSGDRYGFVCWTLVGVVYVLGSLFSRWAAFGSVAVAALGFAMFITYPINLSVSHFWGQTLAMATYVVAFIGSIAIIGTGRKHTPDVDPSRRCKTSALAVLSLILSCVPYPVTTIPGVILGHLARRQIRKHADTRKGLDLAAAGLFLGYVFLGLFALLMVVLISVLDGTR